MHATTDISLLVMKKYIEIFSLPSLEEKVLWAEFSDLQDSHSAVLYILRLALIYGELNLGVGVGGVSGFLL